MECETDKAKQLKVRFLNEERYMKIKKKEPQLKENQLVRIQLLKGHFSKIDKENFSNELFIISEVNHGAKVPLYTLSSLDRKEVLRGQFTFRELCVVKLSKNLHIKKVLKIEGKSQLVTFKDQPDTFRVWIEKDNLTY